MRPLLKRKNQQSGMASIIVVSLLVVLLTLITLGFAKLMGRSVQNASSNETAAAASYAAQSGLNDLGSYVLTNLKSGTYIKSDSCNSLIVDSTGHPGPFYNDSNVTGDNNTRYTCLLVNQRPEDLVYQNIANLKSKVVKLTTDTVTSSIDSYMFSWQSRDYPSHNTAPPSATGLQNETSWNNSNYLPMLRVTLYPVTTSGALDDSVQSNSRTFFLIPASDAPVSSKTFDFLSTADGSKKRVKCDTTQVTGFAGTSDYTCNAVITGLEQVPNIDYFYARITPIYNNVDIKIKGNDIDNRAVKFKNVQAVLDVTAKSGPSAKRLQSRVDTSGVDTTTGNVSASPNLSPDDNLGPDFSLRTATALCKRYKIVNDVYNYLTIDGSCPSLTGSIVIDTPPPVITAMNINGVDSQANTPGGSAYYGTSYISNGGSAQINWNTKDATSCNASGSGWSGSKTGIMTFTGDGVGVGSQTFGGLTDVKDYTITCSGPGSGVSPGVTKTVRAWPPPRVTINDPGNVTAGTSYSVGWTSANSYSNKCDASGYWTASNIGTSGSHSDSIAWNDNNPRTYTITCYDPSGRSATSSWTMNPAGNSCSGTCSGGGGGRENPPSCHADADVVDNGNGTGYVKWNGTCPDVAPGSGYYRLHSSTDGSWNIGAVGSSANATWLPVGTGTHCVGLAAGADPWGWLVDQTATGGAERCKTIGYPQVRISGFYANVWDQGPVECDSSTGYYNQWLCRNDSTKVNRSVGCPDGTHRFTNCSGDIGWYSQLDNGSTSGITCTIKSGYGNFSGSHGGGSVTLGAYGWVDGGGPYPYVVTCDGPTPGPGGSAQNEATACWNGGSCGYTP